MDSGDVSCFRPTRSRVMPTKVWSLLLKSTSNDLISALKVTQSELNRFGMGTPKESPSASLARKESKQLRFRFHSQEPERPSPPQPDYSHYIVAPPSQQEGVNINTVGKQLPADGCSAADTICSGCRWAFSPRGLGARAQYSQSPDELCCLPVSITTHAASRPVGGLRGRSNEVSQLRRWLLVTPDPLGLVRTWTARKTSGSRGNRLSKPQSHARLCEHPP